MPDKKSKRITKVAKFRILKPAGDMMWDELGRMLRDVRYRVFRLANLAVSEAYLAFHLWRKGLETEYKRSTIDNLNKSLRQMLANEGLEDEQLNRYSRKGAVPSYVTSPLSKYKISSITNKNKWKQVIRGQSSLPTFRNDMAIPVRCDSPANRRLEQTENGDVEVDLMLCLKPYPRIVLGTKNMGGGQEAILERLIANSEQSKEGYRQRCFEIKQDRQTKKWWLYITYDFPAPKQPTLNPEVVVGVDLGVSVPVYAATNNGLARLGRRHFQALGARIRSLQNQVDARRRSIQRGGRVNLSYDTARSGHGRKRKLLPIDKLQGRINKAYTTLNHQLSASVIKFAKDQGAGVIQIEDLETLKEELVGTFIGRRWRYHQLQQFLQYKAEETGIELRKVNPKYTSRRCSECGHINMEFTRAWRDAHRTNGKVAKFICPQCNYDSDPDYNAARNISTLDIASKIRLQCEKQGIEY